MLHASELACLSAANLESLAKELRNVCKMLAALNPPAAMVVEREGARIKLLHHLPAKPTTNVRRARERGRGGVVERWKFSAWAA